MSSPVLTQSATIMEFEFSPDINLEFPSVDDFLSLPENKTEEPLRPAAGASSSRPKKKNKNNNNNNNSNNDGQPTEPILLSTSITTHHVKDLNETLQSMPYCNYGLKSGFEFLPAQTANGVGGFNAVCRLECAKTKEVVKELQTEGCFPSKKHAKEAAAGLMGDYIKELPEEIKSRPRVGKESVEDDKDTENWIGRVQIFCQTRRVVPEYSFYASGTAVPGFSCELRIPADPGLPGLDGKVYGSRLKYHRNKRTAKLEAAKEAMLWIKEQPPPTALPQSPSSDSAKFVGKAAIAAPGTAISIPARAGPVEKVTLICPRLGLSLPEYDLKQDEKVPALHDVTAYIRRGPGLKGAKIGPLKGIYGKKNAKQQMAASVLIWLNKEAERLEVSIKEEES